MAYLDNGDSRIYWESHGAGPPLIFAHGVGGNHASWFQQVSALADQFRLITFDHRGFGNSTDEEALGRAAFADDLAKLLEHTGNRQSDADRTVHGRGHLLRFACRQPERVLGLVMADSLVGFDLPDDVRAALEEVSATAAELTQLERVLGATTRRQNPTLANLYAQIASFNAVHCEP